tara:strand:+ start:117 stop:464 length:348 start_codon:yes stop_codon:yes gene_type:complete
MSSSSNKIETDSEYLILKYPEQYEKVVEDANKKIEAQKKLIAVLKEQLADARRPFNEQYDERIAEINTHYEEEYAQGGEEYERIKDEIREEISDDIRDEVRDDIRDELKQEIWNM